MTLNAELSMSIEHNLHHLHHHHHHYHVHHLLQHNHHLHSNNQSALQSEPNTLNHQHHYQARNNIHLTDRQPIRKLTHAVLPLKKKQPLPNKARQSAKATQQSQINFFLFAALGYILSPIDLIPEVIFGIFGILDDIVFLLMCLLCVAIILLYPIFREMRRTIFEKLGIKRRRTSMSLNDTNSSLSSSHNITSSICDSRIR